MWWKDTSDILPFAPVCESTSSGRFTPTLMGWLKRAVRRAPRYPIRVTNVLWIHGIQASKKHLCFRSEPTSRRCNTITVASMSAKRRTAGGRKVCKRHVPWLVSDDVNVMEDRNYNVWWLIGKTNGYNREIHALVTRTNGDIKVMTNGNDTKHFIWYIASYQSKA